jgi:hypothetical protein
MLEGDENTSHDNDRDEPRLKFHLEEYKALRREINSRTQESNTLMRYSMLGIAGVYAWLSKSPENVAPVVYQGAWWVPVLIPFLGGIRSLGVLNRILLIGRYIFLLEENVFSLAMTNIGWEHYLTRNRNGFLVASAIGTWVIMLIVTVAVAATNSPKPVCALLGWLC